MSESEKTVRAIEPPWLSEPPERRWPGDWRLADPRAEREAEQYRERTRASYEDNT